MIRDFKGVVAGLIAATKFGAEAVLGLRVRDPY